MSEQIPDASDPDRLAEVKDTLHYWDEMHASYGPAPRPPAVAAQEAAHHVNRAQIDWLIGQADQVERLRGLLKRLEWEGTHCEGQRSETAACPVCDVLADSPAFGQQPHAPDCWLWAEIRQS